MPSGPFETLDNIKLSYVDSLVCSVSFMEKLGGRGYVLKNPYLRDMEIW